MFKAWSARRIDTVLLGALWGAAPLLAHAQVYKCTQANGTISYQSTPCPGSDKPAIRPSAVQPGSQRAAASRDDKLFDDPLTPAQATSKLVADVQARNRRENEQEAYRDAHKNDKQVDLGACSAARYNLGVLNEQRPVYTTDNKGNRTYVEDKDRAGKIAETQRMIAADCP